MKNDIIGRIEVTSNDILISSCDIVSTDTIKRKNIFNYMLEFLKNYCNTLNNVTEAI